MPDARCPMPDARCPIPDPRSPIPDPRSPDDPDLHACVCSLIEAQEPSTGGWRLAGRMGPISVTATSAAVEALLGLEVPGVDLVTVRRNAVATLIRLVLDDDELAHPLHAAAQIARLLATESIIELGGTRIEKARDRALRRVLDCLDRKVLHNRRRSVPAGNGH
ncbi:MAG TPA: hypothetical protein VGJ13_05905 [Pseudonocardiaceae bacterium]